VLGKLLHQPNSWAWCAGCRAWLAPDREEALFPPADFSARQAPAKALELYVLQFSGLLATYLDNRPRDPPLPTNAR